MNKITSWYGMQSMDAGVPYLSSPEKVNPTR